MQVNFQVIRKSSCFSLPGIGIYDSLWHDLPPGLLEYHTKTAFVFSIGYLKDTERQPKTKDDAQFIYSRAHFLTWG